MKPTTIAKFHSIQSLGDQAICDLLRAEIDRGLPDSERKKWHGHPVWFLSRNPIVAYSKLKDCIRLMFWSGAGFDEDRLKPGSCKFKDVSIRYKSAEGIDLGDLGTWQMKGRNIQWDYKNIYKRKG